MLACVVAFVRGDAMAALRVAGRAPPLVRRVLQTVFAGAVAVAPVTSDTTTRPPIRMHAGADGRLVEGGARRATTTTSTTSPPMPPISVSPPEHVDRSGRAVQVRPRPEPVAPEHAHIVRTGDNLWSIARAEVVRVTGDGHPSDGTIAAYWQRVIALNRATLRSGNPSLIFPGEIVALPTP